MKWYEYFAGVFWWFDFFSLEEGFVGVRRDLYIKLSFKSRLTSTCPAQCDATAARIKVDLSFI